MPHTTPGTEAAPVLPDIPGYRLLRVVGHGGMATVYSGTQLSLGRDVAIKVMLPEALADEVSRRRFENEARTIARLEHPHIVGIHEVGRTREGLPWYSMPFLPHGHLGQRDLKGQPERIHDVLRALLSALGYAHARGVIHRDVKAENVLFDEADRPLLADFGIALRRGYGTRVTMVGLAVGSTAYMAPEQARGHQVDHRTDLYSVGVLAWEMLNGALPYQADDALSMAIQHTQSPIPRLPPALRHWQRFMDRALAKEPGRRFADAADMLDALARVPQREGREAAITQTFRKLGASARRSPRAVWIPVVLLAAAGTGLLLHTLRTPESETAPVASIGRTAASGDVTGDAADAGEGAADPATRAASPPTDAVTAPRAAPISPSDRHIADAERQIRAGNLTTPEGRSALDQLQKAWDADREHLRVPAVATRLFAAIGTRAGQLIARGDDRGAAALLEQTRSRAAGIGQADGDAMRALHAPVVAAITARIDQATERVDRDQAIASLAAAAAAGLDAPTTSRLRRAAQTIPDLADAGDHAPSGMRVVRTADTVFGIANAPVSRAEYARFASATGRRAASCRARGSVLRALAPRSWEKPGFDQAPGDPVVCVTWHDAVDYARWISERTGRGIVVASNAHGAALPPSASAPAEWRSDCAAVCKQRVAVGRGHDDGKDSRALEPDRGYDDVGFRLVHLP
ncbi:MULTISPECIES: bifunctional serine/threonine-protein kinase/formylglycine-generating enzyme family protein [Luteimonas]|uniref:bifunctional serine/threonine-protein kinase/formylglycine-generating enzyme family protein n=1 Tax=Luteimonas TaxID=83614 RepID=UPI000C7CDB78|nr:MULTISPECIES: bifunctional serine/threonine-protein kinase/formylglycine-generating enzyme family protein [Luteimonas]